MTVTESEIGAARPLCRTVRLVQPSIARTILNRATLKIFRDHWALLLFLDYDVSTNIGPTAVPDSTATAPSSPAYSQSRRRAMIRAHFLSTIPPAGSTEQQAASSNTATRTLASEETNEQLVPLWERHPSWPSLSLATGVEHAEPSAIKNRARPSL